MSLPVVSIVIPVFNQWSYTARCLEALRANTPDIPFEVIVVNNASTDETFARLAELAASWPALRVISLSCNTGFSPASNKGAEAARGEVLVFLNNDTEPHPGWLSPLLNELKEPGVGLVGPKLVNPGGLTINHAGYVFGAGAFIGIYAHERADAPAVNQKRDYQALLGACFALPKDLFFAIEGFSLDGLEDIDLCLKIRRRGLVCRYVPHSVVTHVGSVTLTNSAPGTFPVTEGSSFAAKWTTDDVSWDDYRWYILDGKWPGPVAQSERSSTERADDSINLLIDAMVAFREGSSALALEATQQSLAVWDRNPFAFIFWCRMMLALGNRESVVRTVIERLPQFSFYPTVINETVRLLDSSSRDSRASCTAHAE